MQASRFPKTGSIAWGYLDSGGGEGLANLQDAFKKRGYTSAMWKKLGVNVEHFVTERKVHLANMRRGDFEIGNSGWGPDYNDAQDCLFLWQTSTKDTCNNNRYICCGRRGLIV